MSMTGIKLVLVGSYLTAAISTGGIAIGNTIKDAGETGKMLAQQDTATLLGIALVLSLAVGGYMTYFVLTRMLAVMEKTIAVADVQIETSHATQQLLVEVKQATIDMKNQMGSCEKIHTFLINKAGQ